MSDPQSNSNGDSSSKPTATLDVTAVEPRSSTGSEPPVSGLAVAIASLALVVAAIALHRSRRLSS